MVAFTCSILFPACDQDCRPTRPCQSLCDSVRASCQPYILQLVREIALKVRDPAWIDSLQLPLFSVLGLSHEHEVDLLSYGLLAVSYCIPANDTAVRDAWTCVGPDTPPTYLGWLGPPPTFNASYVPKIAPPGAACTPAQPTLPATGRCSAAALEEHRVYQQQLQEGTQGDTTRTTWGRRYTAGVLVVAVVGVLTPVAWLAYCVRCGKTSSHLPHSKYIAKFLRPTWGQWWGWVGGTTAAASLLQLGCSLLALYIAFSQRGGWGFALFFVTMSILSLYLAVRWPLLYATHLAALYERKHSVQRADEFECCAALCSVVATVRRLYSMYLSLEHGRYSYFKQLTFEFAEVCVQLFNVFALASTTDSTELLALVAVVAANLIISPWFVLASSTFIRIFCSLLFDSALDAFYVVYTLSLRSVKDLNIEAAVTVSFPLFMQMLRMRSVSNAAANLRHGVVTSLGYRDVSTSLSAGDKSTLQLSVLPVSASASAGAGPRSAQSSPGQKLVQLKVERNDSARSEKISPQQETPVADVASKDEQEETSRKQTTRRRQKWIALTVAALCTAAGLALVSSTSFRIARQKSVCEDTVGPVVWSAVHKQIYFRDGLLSPTSCYWGGTQELQLAGKQLSALSPGVGEKFTSLVTLNVSHNALRGLPSSIAGLRQLRIVDLSFNQVDKLEGSNIFLPTSLTNLDLSGNSLTFVHPVWWSSVLSSSVSLDLRGTLVEREVYFAGLQLSAIPPSLFYHTGRTLTTLDLSRNNFGSVPAAAATNSLPALLSLDLSHNSISALPSQWVIPQARLLNVSHNLLRTIDDTLNFGSWISLQTLDLRDNQLTHVSWSLNALAEGVVLIGAQHISQLTFSFSAGRLGGFLLQLSNLLSIDCVTCYMPALPAVLASVPNLQTLKWRELQMTPHSIAGLFNISGLRTVELSRLVGGSVVPADGWSRLPHLSSVLLSSRCPIGGFLPRSLFRQHFTLKIDPDTCDESPDVTTATQQLTRVPNSTHTFPLRSEAWPWPVGLFAAADFSNVTRTLELRLWGLEGSLKFLSMSTALPGWTGLDGFSPQHIIANTKRLPSTSVAALLNYSRVESISLVMDDMPLPMHVLHLLPGLNRLDVSVCGGRNISIPFSLVGPGTSVALTDTCPPALPPSYRPLDVLWPLHVTQPWPLHPLSRAVANVGKLELTARGLQVVMSGARVVENVGGDVWLHAPTHLTVVASALVDLTGLQRLVNLSSLDLTGGILPSGLDSLRQLRTLRLRAPLYSRTSNGGAPVAFNMSVLMSQLLTELVVRDAVEGDALSCRSLPALHRLEVWHSSSDVIPWACFVGTPLRHLVSMFATRPAPVALLSGLHTWKLGTTWANFRDYYVPFLFNLTGSANTTQWYAQSDYNVTLNGTALDVPLTDLELTAVDLADATQARRFVSSVGSLPRLRAWDVQPREAGFPEMFCVAFAIQRRNGACLGGFCYGDLDVLGPLSQSLCQGVFG